MKWISDCMLLMMSNHRSSVACAKFVVLTGMSSFSTEWAMTSFVGWVFGMVRYLIIANVSGKSPSRPLAQIGRSGMSWGVVHSGAGCGQAVSRAARMLWCWYSRCGVGNRGQLDVGVVSREVWTDSVSGASGEVGKGCWVGECVGGAGGSLSVPASVVSVSDCDWSVAMFVDRGPWGVSGEL